MARSGAITFGEIAEHLPMITVQCDRCGRHGRYRADILIAKYGAGASTTPLQNDLTKDRPEKNDPHYPFGKCAPMMPDLRLSPKNQPREKEAPGTRPRGSRSLPAFLAGG
jgi:hypothetical protein